MTASWDKEEWRGIPGYEGKYQASSLGRIRSVDHYVTRLVKGRVLRPRIRKEGYPIVTISGAGPKDVHSLVALAFHGPRGEGQQVRHLDGDKQNAKAENLAYGTQADNERDKFRYGNKSRKLTTAEVKEIRKLTTEGSLTYSAIARRYHVTETTVRHIVKGETFAWLKNAD
jgi:hypothetical protein